MVQLLQPDSPELWRVARDLVEQYAASLDINLAFQDFAHEIDFLAQEYGRPTGCFFLADHAGTFVGCGGLRKFSEGICELKRLYVVADHRGLGTGRMLVQRLVEQAAYLRYDRVVLDTLPSMPAAYRLYGSFGFVRIPAYRPNPIPGAAFMELVLNKSAPA